MWARDFWSRVFYYVRFWPPRGGPPFDVDICTTTIEETQGDYSLEDLSQTHSLEDESPTLSLEDLSPTLTIEDSEYTIEECPP